MYFDQGQDVKLTTELSEKVQCVVPENIHTPTTEGIGNSEGEGGSKTQEIPKGRGVVWSIYFPEVPWFNTDLSVDLAVQNSFLTY